MDSRVNQRGKYIWLTPCLALALVPVPADAQRIQRAVFDIQSKDLGTALTNVARQTNREIYFSSNLTRGKRAPRLRGQLTVEQALSRLLDNSGLRFRFDPNGSIVVEATSGNAPRGDQNAASQPQNPPATAPAMPGETDPSDAEKEITVTGSRLGRTTFNSPTPVNVVGQERVQDLNLTNVGEALNQIPAFRPLTTPATNSFRASANIAGRSLDLRGLGASRTLTLIDGRRTVPSGDDGSFDLNSLPSIMIRRSEIVTGGASAAYGADAVSGVVNLILDTRMTGLKAETSYGISEQGDARKVYAALMAGTGFADGRGHIVVGGEYSDEGGVGDFNARDWSRQYHNFIPNPFFSTNPALSNGLPATVATDNVLYALNPAGLISIVHPLQGSQFDNDGNLIPFRFGELFNKAKPSSLMVGGDPSVQDVYGFNNTPLVVPTSHYSALAHGSFELSDSLTASAELSYARVIGGPASGSIRADQAGAIRILRDNAYLTPATAAAMDAAKTSFLPINRSNTELGGSDYVSRNNTWRGFFGLEGQFESSWHWDAFYDYGQTEGTLTSKGQRITARWQQALDAVFAPAGVTGIPAGTIVCRSTLTNPTNGCVPINIMGAGKITPGGAAWVLATAFQTRKFTQHHVGANLRGTLFSGWAGDISAAAGIEYRTNRSEGTADALSVSEAFTSVSASILPRTTQKVTEAYAEVNVPLLKDSAFGKSLEVDAAVRQTHYSLSGSATTWKVGAAYELNDEYMLRVTRSHDIRAPSPLELNPNTRTLLLSQSDVKYGVQYLMPSTSGGNPNLKLETANTLTIGAVFKPSWLPRFRLSIDYYDIKVSDAIDVISAPLAVTLCRAGTNPEVCTIGTDANGNPDRILRLFATYQNVNTLHARGFELVSNYSLDLFAGTVNFTLNGNYVDTLSTTIPDGSVKEFSDVTGNAGSATALFGVPKWRADAVIGYQRPTWAITTQYQFIPAGILNRDWIGPDQAGYSPYLPNSINDNRVDSRLYVNLNGRVKLLGKDDHKIELFGGINNLFDKDPPSNLRLSGNPVYFDPVGRSYKIGLRADW